MREVRTGGGVGLADAAVALFGVWSLTACTTEGDEGRLADALDPVHDATAASDEPPEDASTVPPRGPSEDAESTEDPAAGPLDASRASLMPGPADDTLTYLPAPEVSFECAAAPTVEACCPASFFTYSGTTGDDHVAFGLLDPLAICADLRDGADLAWMNLARDVVLAGAGDDRVMLAPGRHTVHGGAGRDFIHGSFASEALFGGDDDDVIWGGWGRDAIDGGDGDDKLLGGPGGDRITPGVGADVVFAGWGDDVVYIRDRCEVSPGEHLVGGHGNDTLVTAVSLAELEEAGAVVYGFEHVVVAPSPTAATCDVPPNACDPEDEAACNGHGTCAGNVEGTAICACRSGYVGAHCEGTVRPWRKNLNAPPEDFDVHVLPDPSILGERTRTDEVKVQMVDGPGGCEWSYDLAVDATGTATIGFGNDSPVSGWTIEVFDETGVLVQLDAADDEGGEPDTEVTVEGYELDVAAGVTYSVVLRGNGPTCDETSTTTGDFYAVVTESDRAMYVHPGTLALLAGEPLPIVVWAFAPSANPDWDEADEPTAEAPPPAPNAIVGEVTSARLTLLGPTGIPFIEVPMFDDGLNGDGAAGDGKFGRRIFPTFIGENDYIVTLEGTSAASGLPYRRTTRITIPTVRGLLEFDEGTPDRVVEAYVDSAASEFMELSFYLRLGDAAGEVLEAWAAVEDEEFRISAELWARAPGASDEDAIPIAWASRLGVPEIGLDPDANPDGIPSGATINLQVHEQWFINAKALNNVPPLEDLEYEVRLPRLQDARYAVPLDEALVLPVTLVDDFGEYDVLDWLASRTGPFVAPEDMDDDALDGASPEFVEELEELVEEGGFPSVYGDVLLSSGWCGSATMWDRGEITGIPDVDPDNNINRRLIRFDSWFAPVDDGKSRSQVSVSTYADEIAAFMNNYERPNSGEPGRFASLWAYSQGGVAALYVLNDGYTPLDAFRDDESLLIRTVAAEFQGTPASGTWLWGVKPIARAFVRSKMLNCRFRGQTLQLSPTVATLRLAQVKRRSREATAYRRTIHRIAGTRKNFCFWLTSIPFIWGYDDGIAQNSRSALYKGAVAVGVDRELCHAGSKFWIYPFAVDQSSDIPDESPIPEELCQGSFLGDIDGFVCPEAP